MHRLVTIIGLFLLLCFVAQPVFAFMPDDIQLQDKVRKAYGPLTSWEAEMTFPEHPDVKVHLWYARGKWRQEWQTSETAVAVGRNSTVLAKCTDDEFPPSPMFIWMVPNPVQSWKSWGVDNATRSFGFCDSEPCYMFGAEPGDETSPTVQLNNEDMAPILVRFMAGDTLTSVNYGDYRTYGGFRVPQTVRMTIGAEHVLEAKVKWLGVNRADSEELYVRDGVESPWCNTPPPPFDFLRDSFIYPQPK